mmetsp:Transcript_7664/g.11369  ORF Transcript_7664/g.11369 Transcript_7664/m.11369 type:complete len:86 (+) Transcript_7664:746-1003(+)
MEGGKSVIDLGLVVERFIVSGGLDIDDLLGAATFLLISFFSLPFFTDPRTSERPLSLAASSFVLELLIMEKIEEASQVIMLIASD